MNVQIFTVIIISLSVCLQFTVRRMIILTGRSSEALIHFAVRIQCENIEIMDGAQNNNKSSNDYNNHYLSQRLTYKCVICNRDFSTMHHVSLHNAVYHNGSGLVQVNFQNRP